MPTLPRAACPLAAAVLLLAAVPRPAARALDMTLRTESFQQDGLPGSRTYLDAGASRVYLSVPPTWAVKSNDPAAITLNPEVCPEAVVRLESADVPGFTPDDKGGADLQARAARLLPEGAKEIKLMRTLPNVLPIAGWKSWETIYDYNFFGQTLRQSILYLDAGQGRVVRLVVQAPQSAFTRVYPSARGMVLTWHEGEFARPPASMPQ